MNNYRTKKLLPLTWFFLIALLIINLILAAHSFDKKNGKKNINPNSASFSDEVDLQARILELEASNREVYSEIDKMSLQISYLEKEKKILEEQCNPDSE